MTHRDEDEEIIDTALDTLAWQRREIDRLKGDVERLREVLRNIDAWGDEWAASKARAALGEKQ